MKKILGSAFAYIYLIFPMGLVLLILLMSPLMFFSDIDAIRSSGFAGPNMGLSMIGICGLFIGISLLIPVLRRIYAVFPWLYAFVKIFFASLVILNLGITILNFGYQTVNPSRHTLFFVLMIVFVIIGRLCMSFYFHRYPVYKEGE